MKNFKPEIDQNYYCIDLMEEDLYFCFTWENDEQNNMFLERGIIFETEKETVEEAKSLLKLIKLKRMNMDVKF